MQLGSFATRPRRNLGFRRHHAERGTGLLANETDATFRDAIQCSPRKKPLVEVLWTNHATRQRKIDYYVRQVL